MLDDTQDDGAILAALERAELDALPASEWGRALARKVIAVEADNAALRAELEPLRAIAGVAARASRRAWVSLGGGGAAVIAVVMLLLTWAGSRGEARGDARAERARQAADHADQVLIRKDLDGLTRQHAELAGLVRGLFPYRAPGYGPAPQE